MASHNLDNLPPAIIPLVPMAERWGIGDDIDREEAIEGASTEDLEALVRSIDGPAKETLYNWLAGPECRRAKLSEEYVLMSNLAMAIDYAVWRLKLRKAAEADRGE